MELVEVEHVEPPDDRAVEEDGSGALERRERSDEGEHPSGAVRAVHADSIPSQGFDLLGQDQGYGRDGREPVGPVERSVVDADDPRVNLPERAP